MKEIWKPILNNPPYEVSNLGNVRNSKTSKVLVLQKIDNNGYKNKRTTKPRYCYIFLSGRNYTVHRLVAKAFIRCPNYKTHTQVDHIDGDGLNNRVENLRWVTPRQNNAYYTAKEMLSKFHEIYRLYSQNSNLTLTDLGLLVFGKRSQVFNLRDHNVWLDVKNEWLKTYPCLPWDLYEDK